MEHRLIRRDDDDILREEHSLAQDMDLTPSHLAYSRMG
jgi:hypothetical protein